jgi:hypothetical protein
VLLIRRKQVTECKLAQTSHCPLPCTSGTLLSPALRYVNLVLSLKLTAVMLPCVQRYQKVGSWPLMYHSHMWENIASHIIPHSTTIHEDVKGPSTHVSVYGAVHLQSICSPSAVLLQSICRTLLGHQFNWMMTLRSQQKGWEFSEICLNEYKAIFYSYLSQSLTISHHPRSHFSGNSPLPKRPDATSFF